MSQGDNLIGIKTTYKGIEMRSKLETKVAMFLDALKIKWEYEPKTFLLSNGIPYRPDFYLTELKQWIEVKGLILEHNKEISKRFVVENETTLILISSNVTYWYSYKDNNYPDEGYEDGSPDTCEGIQVGKCSHCGHYFLCDFFGSWHCRNCGTHEDDHDLIGAIHNNDMGWDGNISFLDVEDIKRWLDAIKISV